tara:strand:+ start:887 stop:1048 length:162 start_codon:yes stop_codon:yes gene_type:complete
MVTTKPLSKNQMNEIVLQFMKKSPMETGGRLTSYLNEKTTKLKNKLSIFFTYS